MLALNPGFAEVDHQDLQNPDYAEQWRLTLSFQTRTPFYFLDPAFAHTSGFQWWHGRLRELIAIVGIEAVAKKVMCMEHFPYKSVRYQPLGVTLASQEFTFELLREAGVSVNYVSKILGHTNLTTTTRYLNIHRRGLHDAMQKLEAHRPAVAQPLHNGNEDAQDNVPTEGTSLPS